MTKILSHAVLLPLWIVDTQIKSDRFLSPHKGRAHTSKNFKKYKIATCFYLFSLCMFSQSVPTTSTKTKKSRLTGHVLTNNNQPIAGATVLIKETETSIVTNSKGMFLIKLEDGTYTIIISYIGFKNSERQITISDATSLDFIMEAASHELDQVVVKSSKAIDVRSTQMSINRLSMEEIKKIPVVMGEADPLKSILTLPGVTNSGELSSGFNVRGGANDQNLILLDGAPVYGDSHMFGLFSVFNADIISSLDLYKGGIPSKFGGRVSSVLDVNQQTGDFEKYHVNGGIGLISSRLLVQGPIQKDKGSFILAGRASYGHLFLKLDKNNNVIRFYDLNSKFIYRLGTNNTLTFSGYLGNDILDFKKEFVTTFGNTMANLSWKHTFSDNLNTNLSTFYSEYKFDFGVPTESYTWENNVKTYGLKYNWNQTVSEKLKMNYGFEGVYYNFNPGTIEPTDSESQFNYKQLDKKYAFESSVYLDLEHQITEKLNLRYGLRYSMFYRLGAEKINTYENGQAVVYNPLYNIYQEGNPTGSIQYKSGEIINTFKNFEPRAALSYTLDKNTAVKISYNRMAQYIQMLSNSQLALPINIWTPSGPFTKPQLLDQFATGYSKNLSDGDYSFETELFYKKNKNRTDYIDGAGILGNNNIEQVILNGKARSYGAEFFFRKNTGRFTGWVSYTLSRAEQKTPGRTTEEPGIAEGNWYLSGHDKLHNLSVVGSYNLSSKWSFNTNFSLQSGRPTTYANGYYEFAGLKVSNYTLRNQNRLPVYHHLDLSATYTPKPDKTKGWQSYWVFSIYNIYNRRNAASMTFSSNDDTGINETKKLSIYGLVPGVSYNFKF